MITLSVLEYDGNRDVCYSSVSDRFT